MTSFFIITQSRRGQSALRGIANCSLGLNTFGLIRDPSKWQASRHSCGKASQGEGAICQNGTVVGPASCHANLSRLPALGISDRTPELGAPARASSLVSPFKNRGVSPPQGDLIKVTHQQSSKKQDVNCRMNPKDFLAMSKDARQ